ncbi:jg23585 [Pararge aegeria aegeria]|uniref:Jg23585 protein n=1 Tax=Pararge aegeria aegeria TaxID=348720 RepID=A0A8S4RQH6_9NEOP|nr:jg23585 [Pararge aegeria aegeria]
MEGKLHPIEKVAEPLHTIHIDHLGPFCKSGNGMSYLFVIVDSYTKFTWAKPTRTTKAVEVEHKLEEIFSMFGYPTRIVSDSGTAFTSRRFKEFCHTHQIKHITNSIASPRSNGQVERYNRTLLEAINKSTSNERDWDKCIPKVVWGINNTVNTSTGFSAYKLMFHGERTLTQAMSSNKYDSEQDIADNRAKAAQNIAKTAACMKRRFDNKRKMPTIYKLGDLVLWKGAQANSKDAVRKLKEKFSGPYKVIKVLGNDRYIISSIKGMKGYKKYTATVASDSMRRFISEEKGQSSSETDESQADSTEELIDLLEG